MDALPTALILDTAHGPRITAVNVAGREAGAQPGMMLADARTLCPQIQTAPADPAGDLAFLEKLALWAQRWGPWSAVDAPDGVLVDVTGSAHLFGGEAALLDDVEAMFARRQIVVRAAIAPTAGAAWALAHYGGYVGQDRVGGGRVGEAGKGGLSAGKVVLNRFKGGLDRLGPLPVAALRLDEDVLIILRRLGLKALEQLYFVASADGGKAEAGARDALHRRFRNRKAPSANPLIRLDQLLGRVPEPLLPVIAQNVPIVQRTMLEPLRYRTLLDQVVRDLAVDMAKELERRGEGARRLDLGLWRVDGEVIIRHLELAEAVREPTHIIELFLQKLDGIEAGFGIETVRLRASWTQPLAATQADVEQAAERQGTSLAACVDRLQVRLGPQAVCRPLPHASHLPERAQDWAAALGVKIDLQNFLENSQRPLKILDKSNQIEVLYASPDGLPKRFRWRGDIHLITRAEGAERIAPEWWRARSDVRLRDYYRIEDEAGRRYWIYRHGISGDGRGGLPDWFIQGLAA